LLLRTDSSEGFAPTACRQKGRFLLLVLFQVRQYRDERLWGSGGENFDTWKVLKVCSIKGIEPSNALFRNTWEPSLMCPARYLSGFSDLKGSFYPEGEVVADRQSAGILKMSTPSTIMML
jgi:hypothetical protein